MKIRRDLNQGTKEWFEAKLGVITGTVLEDIMGTWKKREDTLHELLGETLTPSIDMDFIHEASMNRGSRLEPEAVLAFEYVTGKKVEKVGLCVSDEDPRIAYSPDGIIAETDDSEDIECKCPEAKNYMKIVMSDEVPKEYKWQIVQGFCVNPKLKKRWFVAYNPDIPSYPIHIIEVTRESLYESIDQALNAQKEFLADLDFRLIEVPTL